MITPYSSLGPLPYRAYSVQVVATIHTFQTCPRTDTQTPFSLRYIFDYVIVFVLLAAFLALDAVEPYHQQFSLQNYTLHYKFAVQERVPNAALVAIAVAAPAGIICIWTLVVDGLFSHKVDGRSRKYTMRDRLWELNCGILGLGLTITMQYVIVGTFVCYNYAEWSYLSVVVTGRQ